MTPWGVTKVRADYAWARATGSGVDLLIIDSGVDSTHFDLDSQSAQACDGSNGIDVVGHGTFVSGIAGAVDNTAGVVGVAPDVNLWSSRVGGLMGPSASGVACAIQYGRANDFFVMSMSLSLGDSLDVIKDEIEAAWSEGHVLVAAAGNTYGGSATFPASHGDVIAVTATDEEDGWAGVGPESSVVEIAAPGVNTISTGFIGAAVGAFDCVICLDTVAATSYAAPMVAAAAAMVKSVYTGWSNEDVREQLQETAVDLGDAGKDDFFGYGRLDVAAALGITPLSVSISGPSTIQPDDENCTWTAFASGGLTPYSFGWYYDGHWVQNGSSWTGGLDSGDTDDEFLLKVWVTDLGGEVDSDEVLVTTSEEAPACPAFD